MTLAAFDEACEPWSDVTRSQMMGHPAYKLVGKIFACHVEGDAVFKLARTISPTRSGFPERGSSIRWAAGR